MPNARRPLKQDIRPVTGHTGLALPGPRVVYTDGSASERPYGRSDAWNRAQYFTGWGYLSTDGFYGFGSYPQPEHAVGKDRAVVAELRAVWNVVKDADEDQDFLLRLDSQHARSLIRNWQAGGDQMPRGYQGSQAGASTLEKLRLVLLHRKGELVTEHIARSRGDDLNVGADRLARLGVRWSAERLTRDEVSATAKIIAETHLRDAGAVRVR